MAKKTINLGTGELTGDGESIRSAFDKINDNFDELYAQDGNDVVLSSINASLIPDTDVAYDLGSASNRFRDIYLSGSTIDLGGLEISNVGGELKLDGVKLITQSELDVAVQNDITTNVTGSVFADDSTLLVDGVAGKIVGDVENSIVYTDVVYARSSDLYVNADDQASLYLGATNSQTIIIGASDSTIYLNGNQDSLVGAGKFFSPRGTDLNIATLDTTTGGADAIIIKGGDTSDSDNGAFGGNVFINGGRNPNALEQDGFVGIGLEYTNGVTIGAYDFGDGFGTSVGIEGVRNYIGEPLNRSVTYLRGTVDFSNATVTNLDVQLSGDLTGSVFADDSTLLVDGVNSKINLQNTVLNNTISTSDENFLINTAATPGDRGFTNITTTDSILDIQGAAALPGGQGGGIYINGGIPFDDPSDYTRYGDIIISGRIISILAGDGEGGGGIAFGGPVIGTTTMDIKGSVFGDDSTTVVDGINGNVTANILTSNTASNFNGTLSVVGVTRLYDDLIIDGGDIVSENSAYFFGNLECSNITNLQNNAFASDDLTLSAEGSIVLNSSASLSSTLNVTGDTILSSNASIGGNLNVTGNNNVQGTFNLLGNATLSGNASIAGDAEIIGNSVISGTLGVTGSVTLANDVNVGGNLDVAGDSSTTGNIVVTGLALVGGSLSVTGDATLSSNVGVNGDLTVAGNLDVAGDTTLEGTVDLSSATVTGLPYATITNEVGGSASLAVGSVMSVDYLNVRLIDKGTTLGVEFNYDPADFTSVIDAYSDDTSVGNVFNGSSNVTVGNTVWTEVTTLGTIGDRITFTLTDHSSHRVYRATVTMRTVPDGGTLGSAYAIIETLK